MPHERLHVGQWERLHGQRAEDVAKVMEPDPLEARVIERLREAATQPVTVEMPADGVHEHEVTGAGEVLPATQPVKGSSRPIHQRHRPHLVALRPVFLAPDVRPADVHDPLGEVDVTPPEGEQFTETQARECRQLCISCHNRVEAERRRRG